MQYSSKEYNPKLHDEFPSLTVKQPYANALVTVAYKDADKEGYEHEYGEKTIEVRSRNTSFRGNLLICSSANPVLPGMESGVTLGFVELYDIKPVSEFTPEDWDNTRIPPEKRKEITKGYGWLMRNPRRVIEYPIKGQLGIYNLIYTKGVIQEYPRTVVIAKKDYDLITKQSEK